MDIVRPLCMYIGMRAEQWHGSTAGFWLWFSRTSLNRIPDLSKVTNTHTLYEGRCMSIYFTWYLRVIDGRKQVVSDDEPESWKIPVWEIPPKPELREKIEMQAGEPGSCKMSREHEVETKWFNGRRGINVTDGWNTCDIYWLHLGKHF